MLEIILKLRPKKFLKFFRQRPACRGFSLVEVLIATALLSIAGVAYLQLSGTVNQSVVDVQEAAMADNAILTLVNEVLAESHLYPSLPTSIYDEREMSTTQRLSGTDAQGKLSPDRFLQSFMQNKCNYRFMAYRCYNFMGVLEFSCEVEFENNIAAFPAIDAPRFIPAACQGGTPGNLTDDPYKGHYRCYSNRSYNEDGISFKTQHDASQDILDTPENCSKMSVWFFKSAVHDLTAARDLAPDDAEVLSPLPMYRMNFRVEYRKAINEAPTELFFSRLLTEISRQ